MVTTAENPAFKINIDEQELSELCKGIALACVRSAAAPAPAAAAAPAPPIYFTDPDETPAKKTRTFKTSQGEHVISSLSDDKCIAALQRKGSGGHAFSKTLLEKKDRFGSWTQAQAAWAHKLANEQVAQAPTQKEKELERASLIALLALLKVPGGKLKQPSIVFENGDSMLRLQLAGARSKKPGSVNVTDGGEYGKNTWYGRIDQAGGWEAARTSKLPVWAIDIMNGLAKDPAGTIRDNSKLTGRCCFCRRKLDQPAAVSMGMGLQCAQNFSTPALDLERSWKDEEKRLREQNKN